MKLLAEGLNQICAVDKTAAFFIKTRFNDIFGALQLYIEEIERFNPAYGLVKADDRETLIVKHILDSLAPLGHIAGLLGIAAGSPGHPGKGKTLADAGSGAGLPGIPLAVCLPDIQVTLIERMGRRAGFLRNTAAVLNAAFPGLELSRVLVEEAEWEKIAQHQFDCLVLRALSPLDNGFAAGLARLLKKGGAIAAYKGKHGTAQKELNSLSGQTELIPLAVPFLGEERCLVLIRQNY